MGTEVKLVFHTQKVVKSIEDTAAKRMAEATQAVRTQVLETLSGTRKPDPSRIYKVPGTQKLYQASSPGEPPAQATAELRQSIKTVVASEGRTIIGKVGTDKIQGLMTEFGTRNMAARPWLKISFKKSMGKVKSIFGREWLR